MLQTPRQAADEALLRIEAARQEDGYPHLSSLDAYDFCLVEEGTDPLTVQHAKAMRTEAGQTQRALKRRANVHKHRG